MKQMFITDLDHTFLRNDLTISTFTKDVWNTNATTALLSVATARSYKKTVEFLHDLNLNLPMILLDGALIVNEKSEIISTKLINRDLANAIIFETNKFDIHPFILAMADSVVDEKFIYPKKRNSFQEELLKRYIEDDNLVEHSGLATEDKNLKLVYMADEALLRPLTEHLKSVFKDSLEFKLAPEAYLGCYFLTVLHPEADKAHGLRTVSEYMSHELSKITVFGDNLNDLGMFELAGTAVAVKNAQEEVKEAADIVLEYTNDEDAVAKYLKEIHV